MIAAPFTLRYLIDYVAEAYVARLEGAKEPNVGKGFGYIIGIVAMQELQSLLTNYSTYRSMIVGGQARALLIAAVYKKSLTISGRAKAGAALSSTTPKIHTEDEKKTEKKSKDDLSKPPQSQSWSNGQVLSLTSIDAHRVDEALSNFHAIWTGLIALLLSLALLIVNLGYSPLAGYGIILLVFPMIGKGIGKLFDLRKQINRLTDQRSNMTYEIIQGIRFVKIFGWGKAFFDRIKAIRTAETRKIRGYLALRNAVGVVAIVLPAFASQLTFVTYALTKHQLASSTIFSSVGIFNVLKLPLTSMPVALSLAADGWSALERLQNYLTAEDREEIRDELPSDPAQETMEPKITSAVRLENASFTWEENTDDRDAPESSSAIPTGDDQLSSGFDSGSTLHNSHATFVIPPTTLELHRGELVAIIGGVGSGKSSILEALTGEMRKTCGTLSWSVSKAYCPQEPWIQNTTVRNNITFGKEMDPERYNRVVHACALTRDFEILPNGDLTEIGERGVNISGGQKQRINLARAMYADAEALLLDSPLSAVDAQVGKHILENAIVKELNGKLRVLVTHQLEILHRCDRIIWVENGSIQAMDTFPNLMAHNESFSKLITAGIGSQQEKTNDKDEKSLKRVSTVAERKLVEQNEEIESLIKTEHQATKSVPWRVYYDYFKSSGSISYIIMTLVIIVVSQGPMVGTNLWLSWWIQDKFHLVLGLNIGIYIALNVLAMALSYVYFLSLSLISLSASKQMYNRALNRVLNTTAAYFDTTPLGRILGVFSKDVDNLDYNLTESMRIFVMLVALFISTCVLTMAYFYWVSYRKAFKVRLLTIIAVYFGCRPSDDDIRWNEHVLSPFGP